LASSPIDPAGATRTCFETGLQRRPPGEVHPVIRFL